MGLDTFYEITRKSIPLTKYDGTYLSICDSVINVRTGKGMNFIEFDYNLECLDKNINLAEFSIASPKSSPAAELCKSKFINVEMKNYDYTEMIVDPAFWPHNQSLTQEMTTVSMSAWSPSFFIDKKSVLAILNNIGGVEFFTQQLYGWKSIIDLSLYIPDCLDYNKTPRNFDELKVSVYIVETSSICWAPKLNLDNACYFVTAQRNNTILFWEIFGNMKAPELRGKIETKMSEIKYMRWIPKTDTQFLLLCSDVVGQVNVYNIKNDDFTVVYSSALWQCQDRMVAANIQYMTINENLIVFYSKHRHFIVQMLDENCKVITQYVKNVNDYRITDIINSVDGFYLSTINVKIYKLHIGISDESLNVELTSLELKDAFSTYELYSFCFTSTNTLCALAMIDRRLLCRKEVYKIDLVFVTTDSKLNSAISTLLSNPSHKLTYYWDCIESLRYKINKTRTMPAIDCNVLYLEGSNDAYKLKIYLILLIFYLNMRKVARVDSSYAISETSVENVKEKILLLHAQSMLDTLFNQHQKDGKLNRLDEESLFGCVKYLEFYSKKHKTNIGMDKETLGLVTNLNFEYVCQSCDDNIEVFTCKSGHINMYCMLSFTPILRDDYLVCKCCNGTARKDLSISNPLCVFCDQYLTESD